MKNSLATLLRSATPAENEAPSWPAPPHGQVILPDMIDREIQAQTDAYAALARLDPPARARVLRWLAEVLETSEHPEPPRIHAPVGIGQPKAAGQ